MSEISSPAQREMAQRIVRAVMTAPRLYSYEQARSIARCYVAHTPTP